jgi:hypothetical protein
MPDLPAVESEANSPQQIILEFFIALVRMLSGEFFLLEQSLEHVWESCLSQGKIQVARPFEQYNRSQIAYLAEKKVS